MGRSEGLAKNTIIYFIGNFASKCLNFVLVPIYTAYLGANDFGYINMLLLLSPIIAQLFSAEILDAAYRFLLDAKSKEEENKVASNSLLIYVVGMFLFLIIFVPIALMMKMENIWVFVLHVIIVNYANLELYLCRGVHRNKVYAVAGVLQTFVQGISNIFLIIAMNQGAISILWAPILSSIAIIIYIECNIKVRQYAHKKYIDISLLKEMLKYSYPLFIQILFTWFLTNAGTYQLAYFSGNGVLSGIYGMINKFPQLVYAITSIFLLAWQESAVREIGAEDQREYYCKTYNRYIILQLLLLIGIFPALRIYMKLVNQGEYYSMKEYLPIVLIMAIVISAVNFISTGYVVLKKTKKVILSSFIPAIIALIINHIFIPSIQIYAVILGSLIGYIVMYVMRIGNMYEELGVQIMFQQIVLPVLLLLFSLIGYYTLNLSLYCIFSLFLIIISIWRYRTKVWSIFMFVRRKI